MSKVGHRFVWLKEAAYITRYTGSGLLNTVAGFLVIFGAMAMGVSPLHSNIAGYAVGFVLGFIVSKKFVFRSNGHFVAESMRYLIAFAFSFAFNLAILHGTLNYMQLDAVLSQIFSTIGYTTLMYILTRYFVFDTTGLVGDAKS